MLSSIIINKNQFFKRKTQKNMRIVEFLTNQSNFEIKNLKFVITFLEFVITFLDFPY